MFRILEAAKAACFRSLTMAWSYLLGLAGTALACLDDFAALFADPAFAKQVETVIGADPKVAGKWLTVVSLITIASRARGVIAKKRAP